MNDQSLISAAPKQQALVRLVRSHTPHAQLERGVMAADKSKPRFGAKSEFVRSLDPSMPAAEVVELAAKRGMKLTTALVYNIRSAAKARGTANTQVAAQRRKAGSKAATQYRPGSAESQLRAAIAQIGLSRAREILEEVEATFAGR